MQRAEGFVQQGGIVAKTTGISAAPDVQASYPNATVTVFLNGTLTLASIFSDNFSTPLANPFTANSNGFWFFYAANGRYDVKFSGGGLPAPWTLADILLADPTSGGSSVSSVTAADTSMIVSPNVNAVTVKVNPPDLWSQQYNFTPQAPGGSLIVGSNTITLAPVPLGVNGTDTNHYLYITGGTGTAEPVLITGGTAVSGAATGTVIVTCVNTHSGAWTIGSATAGAQEAVWVLPSTGGTVQLPEGSLAFHAPVKRRLAMPIWVRGVGEEATTVSVQADFPTGANGVFDWSPGDAGSVPMGGIADMSIHFIQPDSTNLALYTHWPPGFYSATSGYHVECRNITVVAAWVGFSLQGNNNGASYTNIRGSAFSKLFDIETTGHSFDSVFIEQVIFSTVGLTANQITAFLNLANNIKMLTCGSVDGIYINKCTAGAPFGDFNTGSDSLAALALITNTWMDVGGLTVKDGTVIVCNCQLGNAAAFFAVSQTGGVVAMANCNFAINTATGKGISAQAASSTTSIPTPKLLVANCNFDTGASDNTSILATCVTPYTGHFPVGVANCNFNRTTNTAYVNQTILVQNGTGDTTIRLIGGYHSPVGSGSGTALQCTDDNDHQIDLNDFNGYAVALAAFTKTMFGAGNQRFTGATPSYPNSAVFTGTLSPAVLSSRKADNWVATETGVNNAIVILLKDAAGNNIPLAAGLRFSVLLAHSLQVGANTISINGTVVNIKSGYNPANNIGTAYAVGGIFSGMYDGTRVLDSSQ